MTRSWWRAVVGSAVLLLALAACGGGGVGGDEDADPSRDGAGSTSTSAAEAASLEDLLLTADDVPEPLGPSAPSEDPTWILQTLCDGRPDVVIPAPAEIVDAGFEGPDDDVWLSSTVARFEEDGAEATIDAYRSEVDRCSAEEDIDRDALGDVGDDGLLVRTDHGEGEGVRRWVARVGDLVIEVSVHWVFADPTVLDRLLEEGPALLETVVGRADGSVPGGAGGEDGPVEPAADDGASEEDDAAGDGVDGVLIEGDDLGDGWSVDGPGEPEPFADVVAMGLCDAASADTTAMVSQVGAELAHREDGTVEVAAGRFADVDAADAWMTATAEAFRGCAADTEADVLDDGDAAVFVAVSDLDDLGDEAIDVLAGALILDDRPTGGLELVIARQADLVVIAQVARTDEVDAAMLADVMLERA